MGGGRVPGALGADGAGVSLTTPHPLGYSQSKPVVVDGVGPLGAQRAASGLTYEQFSQAVLERQIARAKTTGKTYFAPLADDELETVEGKYRMRKAAAKSCRELLKAARTALAEGQKKGDGRARLTRSIGICSAYRDYNYDSIQWRNTFKKHYDIMIKKGTYAGREHGKDALLHMLTTMLPLKAAPGFSNHSNGTAVDFQTNHSGTNYVADSSQHEGWRRTWLHPWLVANAAGFGFRPLGSEEWHWDHG
jgi:hypothetical protein